MSTSDRVHAATVLMLGLVSAFLKLGTDLVLTCLMLILALHVAICLCACMYVRVNLFMQVVLGALVSISNVKNLASTIFPDTSVYLCQYV